MNKNRFSFDSEETTTTRKTKKAKKHLEFTSQEAEELNNMFDKFLEENPGTEIPEDQYNNISSCLELKDFEEKITKKLKKSGKRVGEYNRDHSGCTDFMCSIFEKYIIYIPNRNCFMCWNGIRWKPDTPSFVLRLVELSMNAIRDGILKSKDPSKSDIAFAHACYDMKTIRAVFELLKARVTLNSPEDETFDTHPELLNVINGTVNLKTGKLQKHRRKDYITQIVPLNYNPDASIKVFKSFLSSIYLDDQSLIKYVQTLLGYGITGETKEQCMYIFYGNGSNGKSTLLETLEYILGGYIKTTPATTFIKNVSSPGVATPELVALKKARMVSCNEWEENERLNESRVKTLVGSGSISVRALYGEQFSYQPIFKIFLDTNHYPRVNGADYGIWRRLRVIPFEANFKKKKHIDPDIKKKLFREAEGILYWLIRGAKRYYREGLNEPKAVKEATKRFKREEDVIGAFISDCIEKKPGSLLQASELYQIYLAYCKIYSTAPQTETVFGRRMIQEGYIRKRKGAGNFYINITVTNKDML